MYLHSFVILKFQLASGQLVVLPCSGAGIHGSVGDGYQASGPRSPEYFQLHHTHALTHLLTGGLKGKDACER